MYFVEHCVLDPMVTTRFTSVNIYCVCVFRVSATTNIDNVAADEDFVSCAVGIEFLYFVSMANIQTANLLLGT
jgi:hypothetical protein